MRFYFAKTELPGFDLVAKTLLVTVGVLSAGVLLSAMLAVLVLAGEWTLGGTGVLFAACVAFVAFCYAYFKHSELFSLSSN